MSDWMSMIVALELFLALGALVGLWYLWQILSRVVVVLDGVVAAQAEFAPVVVQMGDMMQSVWESQETRKQVLADHDRQAQEHAAMLQKLDNIQR